MYLGQVLFQNYMWPTLEIRVPRKAASTNTTASKLLNVVKDNYTLKEDGLHVFQSHSKMSKNKLPDLAKKASVERQLTVNLTTTLHTCINQMISCSPF